ncbi:short chain dehydrogenase [Gemmatimonadales bacterium]|nr:short chain dehydrogenase [Gemmatimonadales bacterium]
MRVLLVGATGTVGSAIATALESAGDSVVSAGLSSGDYKVDLAEPQAVRALIDAVGPVDALVCAAGLAQFGSVEELDDQAYKLSLSNKLMGQVNLVRFGLDTVRPNGSFTLTSGTLSTRPTLGTAAVAMVGSGVEAFVRAAALDLKGRYRVNAVSPGWVAESRQAMGLAPMPGIWAHDLAKHYVSFVHGNRTGVVEEAEVSP